MAPDNIFVLCTGRCGSATFTRACAAMTNFTAGHESRAQLIAPDRFAFPPGHIEIDNRLTWHLARLEAAFPEAWYVHLHRNEDEVVDSYDRRWTSPVAIMPAYRNGILKLAPTCEPRDIVRDMVRNALATIDAFLVGKSRVMDFPLEDAARRFPEFWRWIGAEGDLDAALETWTVRHNASRIEATPADSPV